MTHALTPDATGHLGARADAHPCEMSARGLQEAQHERSASRPLAGNTGLRMIVADDGIHFVERGRGDSAQDLAGLTFFSRCLGRVTDTFLAASDNVIIMSASSRTVKQPETAEPTRGRTRPKGRSRRRWVFATDATVLGLKKEAR